MTLDEIKQYKLEAEILRLHAEIEARKTAAEKVYLEQVGEIVRLRAALQQIVTEADSDDGLTAWDGAEIARRALESKP